MKDKGEQTLAATSDPEPTDSISEKHARTRELFRRLLSVKQYPISHDDPPWIEKVDQEDRGD